MFIRTDDPIRDFDRWDREQAQRLAKLPKCSCCGEPIDQDKALELDGELICDSCIEDNKVYIESED